MEKVSHVVSLFPPAAIGVCASPSRFALYHTVEPANATRFAAAVLDWLSAPLPLAWSTIAVAVTVDADRVGSGNVTLVEGNVTVTLMIQMCGWINARCWQKNGRLADVLAATGRRRGPLTALIYFFKYHTS